MIKWQYKPLHFSSSRSLIESELVEELAQKPFGARRLKPCVASNRLLYSTGASILSFLFQESNGACYARQFRHQKRKNVPLLSLQLLRLADAGISTRPVIQGGGRGALPYKWEIGMLVGRLIRSGHCRFWSHLGCSGPNTNIFTPKDITSVHREISMDILCSHTLLQYARLYGSNNNAQFAFRGVFHF